MRLPLLVVGFLSLFVANHAPASATTSSAVTIETTRYRGSPGVFTASGAFTDAGSFTTVKVHISGIGAPTFLIVHAVYEFTGDEGTFLLDLEIKETLTEDPALLVGHGTWVIHSGTGAYADLHGHGEVNGTVDEHTEPALFLRTYTGEVHFD